LADWLRGFGIDHFGSTGNRFIEPLWHNATLHKQGGDTIRGGEYDCNALDNSSGNPIRVYTLSFVTGETI